MITKTLTFDSYKFIGNHELYSLLFIFEYSVFVVELFCSPDPCLNGASCDEDADTCACTTGYTGEFCETGREPAKSGSINRQPV